MLQLLLLPVALFAWLVSYLPQVTVSRRQNPPPRANVTDTGLAYVCGLADRGPADAVVEVRNLTQFIAAFGGRQTYSGLYDWLDTFFHVGGARALIGRVVGPAAAKAKVNLLDGAAGVSLIVQALYPGSYANTWTVVNAASGGNFTLTVTGTAGDGTAFTETATFATTADAVAYAWQNFTVAQGASTNDPVAVSTTLGATTTGTDDRGSITDTQWATARALMSADFGPGQAVDVDRRTTAGHAALITAAAAKGRVAVLDYTDTATAATILSSLATDRAVANSDVAAAYVNWFTIQPLAGATLERSVPPSAVVAGIMARNDGNGLSVNEPPAGANGVVDTTFVTGLTQPAWSDADRTLLNAAGGNAVLDRLGTGIQIYGARTLADPTTSQWTWVSNARFYTLLRAGLIQVGDRYAVGRVNPHVVADFHGAADGYLSQFWPDDLVDPDLPDDISKAISVDTSENTAETMEAGKLLLTASVKIAGVAEWVDIQLVKIALTEPVA
jgi:hypothetical protein